jgi:hypothetical protein
LAALLRVRVALALLRVWDAWALRVWAEGPVVF